MDSITQIVLGAAVGEAVLGKKVGNRALLWGAAAGTIPDLDVYCGYIFDDLTKNEMHRGFSHSLLFSLLFSPIFAWLVMRQEKLFSLDFYCRSSWGLWFWNRHAECLDDIGFGLHRACTSRVEDEPIGDRADKKSWTRLCSWYCSLILFLTHIHLGEHSCSGRFLGSILGITSSWLTHCIRFHY